ncbi:hypothetical protein HYW75_05865 [Candidatus Pacearchaeota archaeon]|nr:hypothetical protein [Candidatus Pacearchaeota archaeon]
MSHLEDVILKIIELKSKGLDDLAVAQNLDLQPETVQLYEKAVQDSIKEAVKKGYKSSFKIANKLQISPVAFNIITSHYQIAFPSEEKQRRSFEERLQEINIAISVKGCDSLASLAREMDLERISIYRLLKKAGICFLPKRKPDYLKAGEEKQESITIEKIQESILQGNDSPRDLAKFFNVDYQTARKWQEKFGFCFMTGRYRTLLQLKEAEKEGLSIQETISKTDLSYSYIRLLSSQFKINLIDSPNERPLREQARKEDKKNKLFYRFVRRGLTLEQIGDKFDLSREGIRQKINKCGLYGQWRTSRSYYEYNERERQLQQERGKLIDVFQKKVQQQFNLIDEVTQWAEKKATEYKLSLKGSSSKRFHPLINFEELVAVFRYYREAQLKGEKLSFEKISKRSGLKYASQSKKLFDKVGLQSLNWQVENTNRLSEEQKEMISRSRSIKMNNSDRAFFMNLPVHTLINYGIKGSRVFVKVFGYKGVKLTYRLASQIYEAQDTGFNREEILELFNTSPIYVDYALEHREEIAPKIIDALNVLHPGKNYRLPYKNS